MKKFSIILTILFAVTINAQSLSGIKICIDPGHGGHDPANDRYIPETGFWESDGNWEKALFTRDLLEEIGATVILTRHGNTDADEPSLSTRAAIANSNNVDFFHSIHSNGFNGTSNYSLLLYKETNSAPAFPEAKAMGSIMVNEIFKAHRTTNKYNRGDQSFLGFHLGVLNPLNMPGTLSEGSFHDYIPESWRLMNSDYRKHEAIAIRKSFLEYFNAGQAQHGEIAGILRDPNETVSYYSIPGTNDNKKPLNYISVTVEPGHFIYEGDDLNNGFYLFDKLVPGPYKVYLEAEDHAIDSAEVSVAANTTVFADKFLTLVPNTNPPQIVDFLPDADGENVSLKSRIVIDFDVRMNTSVTGNAYSISPNTGGTKSWSHNDKRLTFTPSSNFSPGTEYTISVSTSAISFYNVNMSETFSSSFTTRTKLNLLANYPTDLSTDISGTVEIYLTFDAPIDGSTLYNNIFLLDENDNFPPVIVEQGEYYSGRIIFRPQTALIYDMDYRIILNDGIGDTEGLFFGENKTITFHTEQENSLQGIVFDDFENENWKQPEESGGTLGIVDESTIFSLSNNRLFAGDKSGMLEYLFDQPDGICALESNYIYDLSASETDFFGIWIYGDISGNLLEYKFLNELDQEVITAIDTLNWTGWKFKHLTLSETGATGMLKFSGINIRRTTEGRESGTVYFDDAQFEHNVTGIGQQEITRHLSFGLLQNYPNPFNPETKIRFTLPEKRQISLTIFNILGEAVSKIIDNIEMNAGVHEVIWNSRNSGGLNLPSGVYFYKLSAGEFNEIKKMVLLR